MKKLRILILIGVTLFTLGIADSVINKDSYVFADPPPWYTWEQDYWVDPLYSGSGLSNFEHIKTCTLSWGGIFGHDSPGSTYYEERRRDIVVQLGLPLGTNLYEWTATHHDLLVAGWGAGEKEDFTEYNPNIRGLGTIPAFTHLGYCLYHSSNQPHRQAQKFLAAQEYALTHSIDFETFFVHLAQDIAIPGFTNSEGVSTESTLDSVIYFNASNPPGSQYADWTMEAFGNKYTSPRQNYYLSFAAHARDILYLGGMNKFTELNVNLSQGADGGQYTIQYWNGSSWQPVTLIENTTNNFSTSGLLRWFPPADWQGTVLPDFNPSQLALVSVYYIRIVTDQPGTIQPIAHTYQLATVGALQNLSDINGGNNGTEAPGFSAFHSEIYMPRNIVSWEFDPNNPGFLWGSNIIWNPTNGITFLGWDEENDINGDGYVSDEELNEIINNPNNHPNCNPNATARFKHQARSIDYFDHGFVGWGTHLANPYFQNFVIEFSTQYYQDNIEGEYDGIFFDCLDNRVPTRAWFPTTQFIEYSGLYDPAIKTSVEYLMAEFQTNLFPGGIIIGNTNLREYDNYLDVNDGAFGECFFTVDGTHTNTWSASQQPTYLIHKFNNIIDAAADNRILVIQGHALHDPIIGEDREQIFNLAGYYLVDYNTTYFSYQSPNHYDTPYWFGAIEYDIGPADGDYYQWATGVDPSHTSSHYYIFARDRANGNKVIVKFKPYYTSSSGADSETPHELGGSYYLLQADGTLSAAPVTSITLRNNEGAILIDPDNVDNPSPPQKITQGPTSRDAALINEITGDSNNPPALVSAPEEQPEAPSTPPIFPPPPLPIITPIEEPLEPTPEPGPPQLAPEPPAPPEVSPEPEPEPTPPIFPPTPLPIITPIEGEPPLNEAPPNNSEKSFMNENDSLEEFLMPDDSPPPQNTPVAPEQDPAQPDESPLGNNPAQDNGPSQTTEQSSSVQPQQIVQPTVQSINPGFIYLSASYSPPVSTTSTPPDNRISFFEPNAIEITPPSAQTYLDSNTDKYLPDEKGDGVIEQSNNKAKIRKLSSPEVSSGNIADNGSRENIIAPSEKPISGVTEKNQLHQIAYKAINPVPIVLISALIMIILKILFAIIF